MPDSTRDELQARCDAIERAYEFQIAYAGQGLDGDVGSKSGGELRNYLTAAERAMSDVAAVCSAVVAAEGREPSELYRSFIDILEQDASRARAAVRLVLAQPTISSQLIDNLNASMHVRTILTDLFVLDEIFKRKVAAPAPSPAS